MFEQYDTQMVNYGVYPQVKRLSLEDDEMLIGELMRCTGVTRDAIRHYEQLGLLHEAHFTRLENGYRDYNDRAIERIEFIRKGQNAGFKLWQITKVADDWENNEMSMEEKREILQKQLIEINARIDDLQSLRSEIEALLMQEVF